MTTGSELIFKLLKDKSGFRPIDSPSVHAGGMQLGNEQTSHHEEAWINSAFNHRELPELQRRAAYLTEIHEFTEGSGGKPMGKLLEYAELYLIKRNYRDFSKADMSEIDRRLEKLGHEVSGSGVSMVQHVYETLFSE